MQLNRYAHHIPRCREFPTIVGKASKVSRVVTLAMLETSTARNNSGRQTSDGELGALGQQGRRHSVYATDRPWLRIRSVVCGGEPKDDINTRKSQPGSQAPFKGDSTNHVL